MKKPFRLCLVLPVAAIFATTFVSGQSTAQQSSANDSGTPATLRVDDQRIETAQQQIKKNPTRPQLYNELALACIRNARDTSNPVSLEQAQTAIQKGLSLAPGDFQLEKAGVALLLEQKKYTQALDKARELSKSVPDDVTAYGYVAEADIALGNNDEAGTAVQWMLNMRPNNLEGLLLGADLRVAYGDTSGALEFLNQAFSETPQIDPGELVWIANQIAKIEINSGELEAASQTLARADEIASGLPATSTNLALLRTAQAKLGKPEQPAKPASSAPQVGAASATVAANKSTPAALPVVTESRDTGGVPAALLIPRPTGTDRLIRKMQAQVAAQPKDAAAYAGLGAAFFQRARETGNVEDYQLAEQTLTKSLDMDSTDLSATNPLESMAQVCMGEHRFDEALAYAQKALALGSGDLSAFATVGDAYADMGDYEKASIAYSRLQPVSNAASVEPIDVYAQQTRTAYLDFVSGDTDAAIREMQSAVAAGEQARLPSENLAWLYFELGEFSYQAGKISAAADAYLTAITVHPGDYRALAGLGKVRASQGQFSDAIKLYQSAITVVPMPIYISELGDIYAKTGDAANAERQYKLVEYIGLLGHINQVLHNRDLALFYADHDRNLSESLVLARKEFEVRSDIYTWDALAWSLYKNGKFAEANEAMSHAQRLGTKDATILFHAGMISAKLGQDTQAATQLNGALSINPNFNLRDAPLARRQLQGLHPKALVASGASGSAAPPSALGNGSSAHVQ